MRKLKRCVSVIVVLASIGLTGGCGTAGGQICRPDYLSHPEIRFDDRGNRYVIDDHIYFSKEGSSGGRGLGGGGCGCN
jgi:Domain of unknown function (DUF4266)